MSPLVDARCLSGRGSPEGHCDRGIWFPRTGHCATTFLFPFAPPRFAARVHRYYGNSDSCHAASSEPPISRVRPPSTCDMRRGISGPLVTQCPPLRYFTVIVHVLNTRQVSLLISIERPTIPSSTTAVPFHHARFVTLHHRHGRRVYPPGRLRQSGDLPVARSEVRPLQAGSPTGLAESGSLMLRTGCFPQVAPHLSSRRRSYLWSSGW